MKVLFLKGTIKDIQDTMSTLIMCNGGDAKVVDVINELEELEMGC